jgi:hypothetical protein
MEYYSEQYMREYREWKKPYTWPHGERKTVQDEVSYLSASKDVERNSFVRVRSAVLQTPGGIAEFEHNERMRNEAMMDAGRDAVRSGEVKIREPAAVQQLITKGEEEGNVWGVVSVSWSRRFILGVLLETGLLRTGEEEEVAGKIMCNELLAPLLTKGSGSPDITCTAEDKLNALHALQLQWNGQDDVAGSSRPVNNKGEDAVISIYVGDSMTDIGCLTSPSLGFYLNDGQAEDPVRTTLAGLNVQWLSVDDLPISNVPERLSMQERSLDQTTPTIPVCSIQSLNQLLSWLLKIT